MSKFIIQRNGLENSMNKLKQILFCEMLMSTFFLDLCYLKIISVIKY